MRTISGLGRRLCIKGTAIRLRRALTTTLLLLLLTLPAVVKAQSYTDNYGTWDYTNYNGTITITGYSGPGGTVVIPSTINGLPVTTIGGYVDPQCGPLGAFEFSDSLTTVTIPSSVTMVERYAFAGCLSLTSVYFQGNAPSVGWIEVFNWLVGYTNGVADWETDPATVYYLPGTTGWGTEFSVLHTALWLPQVLTSDASFGVQANQFGFTINWSSGMTVAVDACTDLSNPTWIPLATNTLASGSLYFSDPQWTNYSARFYRLRWP